MKRVKVAIADDNELTLKMICEIVGSDDELEIVGQANDGQEIVNVIRNKQPDVVLLDVLMPKLDGIAVMDYVNADKTIKKPAFIMISSFDQKNLTKDAFEGGADYYMLKPFDRKTILNRIKRSYLIHMSLKNDRSSADNAYGITNELKKLGDGQSVDNIMANKLENDVTDILRKIGIPANLKGYQYIRTAIIMAVKDVDVLDGITKILYPSIAKKYNSTTSRVERSVRHAIEVAWERGNESVINDIFDDGVASKRGKPSNSEFIALISDKIRLKYNLSS